MKTHKNGKVVFCCDACGTVAGISDNEQDALKRAREHADAFGWVWQHPGWQLYCEFCKSSD